jgi:hypothetical protein
MVALLLAIAAAMLVARGLEARSIYSGRIHAARQALPKQGSETISAAARTPEVLRKLSERPDGELGVVDQDGHSLGLLSRYQALAGIEELWPTEIVIARDLLPATSPASPVKQAAVER